MTKRILDLCRAEAEADKRRATAAREGREARREIRALLEVLDRYTNERTAPRSGRGGISAQLEEAHNGTLRHRLRNGKIDLPTAAAKLAKRWTPDYLKAEVRP